MNAKKYPCNDCSAPCNGIRCVPCERALLDRLLGSPTWCAIAATRTRSSPDESLLDEIRRERASLGDAPGSAP